MNLSRVWFVVWELKNKNIPLNKLLYISKLYCTFISGLANIRIIWKIWKQIVSTVSNLFIFHIHTLDIFIEYTEEKRKFVCISLFNWFFVYIADRITENGWFFLSRFSARKKFEKNKKISRTFLLHHVY